ncbi:hypothetical protein TIFTF001_017463 [Ficus carica]|uniref:Uncharacterized protein n=1 Tax=Ficus carica TaxID=3494 RepID=A0AA88A2C0_FICCA|nr:hypothetical protein TIFTF001_017463 [Ficus carica]
MKGILVPLTTTYVGLIELVMSDIGLRGQKKTIVISCNNLIIPSLISPPISPPIPSPIIGLDLHMEDELEEQDEFLNSDLGMDHDDCNAREFNIEEAARDSNERNIVGSIGA